MFNIFTAYAHADEPLRDELETHLAMLKREGRIAVFHDRKLLPGQDWRKILDERLLSADVVVLLISPDFLASDYCFGIELATALEMQQQGRSVVVPVIARPCDWKHAPLSGLQAVPTDARPITVWPNRDEAFLNVTLGIRALLETLAPKAIPIELTMDWSPTAMVAARANRMMFGALGRVPASVALIAPDQGVLGQSFAVLAVATDQQRGPASGRLARFEVRGGTFGGVIGEPNLAPGQPYIAVTDEKGSAMAKVYPEAAEVVVSVVIDGFEAVWARTLCAAPVGG